MGSNFEVAHYGMIDGQRQKNPCPIKESDIFELSVESYVKWGNTRKCLGLLFIQIIFEEKKKNCPFPFPADLLEGCDTWGMKRGGDID